MRTERGPPPRQTMNHPERKRPQLTTSEQCFAPDGLIIKFYIFAVFVFPFRLLFRLLVDVPVRYSTPDKEPRMWRENLVGVWRCFVSFFFAWSLWKTLVAAASRTSAAGSMCWTYHAVFFSLLSAAVSAHKYGRGGSFVPPNEKTWYKRLRALVDIDVSAPEIVCALVGMFSVYSDVVLWPERENPFVPQALYSGFCTLSPTTGPWVGAFVMAVMAAMSWASFTLLAKYT